MPCTYADQEFSRLLEVGSLLDVQFEIGGERAARDARVGEMCQILAVTPKPIRNRETLLVLPCEYFWPKYARGNSRAHCADAEMIAFFVGPNNDFQWVPGLYSIFVECADHLDGAKASDIAVEISAFQNRVDVRAEQERGKFGRARARAKEITAGVGSHFESGLLHPAGDVFASGEFALGVSEPRNAAIGIAAKFAQFFEAHPQLLRVDVKRCCARFGGLSSAMRMSRIEQEG